MCAAVRAWNLLMVVEVSGVEAWLTRMAYSHCAARHMSPRPSSAPRQNRLEVVVGRAPLAEGDGQADLRERVLAVVGGLDVLVLRAPGGPFAVPRRPAAGATHE